MVSWFNESCSLLRRGDAVVKVLNVCSDWHAIGQASQRQPRLSGDEFAFALAASGFEQVLSGQCRSERLG